MELKIAFILLALAIVSSQARSISSKKATEVEHDANPGFGLSNLGNYAKSKANELKNKAVKEGKSLANKAQGAIKAKIGNDEAEQFYEKMMDEFAEWRRNTVN